MRPRTDFPSISLVEEATQTFLDWAAAFLYPVDDPFSRAKILATRLGAHYRADGLTEIAFWVPKWSQTRKVLGCGQTKLIIIRLIKPKVSI